MSSQGAKRREKRKAPKSGRGGLKKNYLIRYTIYTESKQAMGKKSGSETTSKTKKDIDMDERE